ncbi:hypothetical protein H6P81_018453 [Aristolochia fimbriata]|uniref:Dirigent protein n=1 Tax=Aristolochia fimbriata TaxID=158543 RepID=A0AAV7E336_ARIFI|nr:hypothetical protein H6P81_018453 [Aristolochia fimbriata]
MGKAAQSTTLLLVLSLVLALSSTRIHGFGEEFTGKHWRQKLGLGKEKITRLRFFYHDTLSGKNPSSVPVAKAATTDKSPTLFGQVNMADDPLTEGPDPSSKEVGRAQGLYALAGQKKLTLIMVMGFSFTEGKYNGSSFSLLTRNPALNRVKEWAIVGGRGRFRMARGYIAARTISNNAAGDAIVEVNATLVHY